MSDIQGALVVGELAMLVFGVWGIFFKLPWSW
jgi:hypothetical protein